MYQRLVPAIILLFLFSLKGEAFLVRVAEEELPLFEEQDIQSLVLAWERQVPFLQKIMKKGENLSWGDGVIPAEKIFQTGKLLIQTIKEAKDREKLNKLIKERFYIYTSSGDDGRGSVLFTGYYTPTYQGSLVPTPRYRWPVYKRPPELYSVDLGLFYPHLKGREIAFVIKDEKVLPYYTREKIVKDKVLEGRGLEIVWLKDRVERFFLMIQGSGKILLAEGGSIWLKYDCKNGRPYTSVGRLLIEDEELPPRETSPEGMKRYFRKHPHKMDKYLFANQSWVFFKVAEEGPHGCIDAILTPRRSIATDKAIFPAGGVAYIIYDEPVVNSQGEVVHLKRYSGFVFDQDKGSAIEGPGRVDVYIGEGEEAGRVAGRIYSRGRIYYLLAK
jgi:membrane-bound lytic murein transglycosylase A